MRSVQMQMAMADHELIRGSANRPRRQHLEIRARRPPFPLASLSPPFSPFFFHLLSPFLRAKVATALAHFSHRNSVCPSVRPSVSPSVTRVDKSKKVQARITKSLSLAV